MPVAPPQDSLKRTELGNGSDPVLHPWWEIYQPVGYQLTSRMGNETQFKAMVQTCREAGVKVYVDAVMNHMTGQGSQSYGGVSYSYDSYRDLFGRGTRDYRPRNSHSSTGQCPAPRGASRTSTTSIRGVGTPGRRAKHIPQADLIAIRTRLRDTVDGGRPTPPRPPAASPASACLAKLPDCSPATEP